MTKNHRHEAFYDRLNDERIESAKLRPTPVTLPKAAYGPMPLEWAAPGSRTAVWAWISWSTGPATRLEAFATGWNDRVVVVEWNTPTGSSNTVVWRNAVTRRRADAKRAGT